MDNSKFKFDAMHSRAPPCVVSCDMHTGLFQYPYRSLFAWTSERGAVMRWQQSSRNFPPKNKNAKISSQSATKSLHDLLNIDIYIYIYIYAHTSLWIYTYICIYISGDAPWSFTHDTWVTSPTTHESRRTCRSHVSFVSPLRLLYVSFTSQVMRPGLSAVAKNGQLRYILPSLDLSVQV